MQYLRTNFTTRLFLAAVVLLGSSQVSAYGTDVKLSWSPNSESDLAGYNLYYGTSSRNYTTSVKLAKVSNYTVTGLGPGTYYFALSAYDTSGNESAYSSEVSAVVVAVTALPTVTISATDPNASESGPDAGTFTASRTGSTSAALTVNYTVGGTASAGGDYAALPGSVTFGTGAASVTITVAPSDDTAVEGNESVIVTLSSNAAYAIGTPASATVTIADNADTIAPVISGVGASSITTASATISWTTNELSDTQVDYGTTTAYGNSTALASTLMTSHVGLLTVLQKSTLYHYRVRSRDEAGNLAVSGDFTFMTDQDSIAPGDVKNFTALPGDGQVSMNWTNPPDSDLLGVLIRCRTDGVFPATKDDGILVLDRTDSPDSSDSFLHTGLTNGTTYYYTAFAYDTSGNYSLAAHAQASPLGVTILVLSPNSGGTDAEVKVSGSNFGAAQGSGSVTFSGIAASVSAWSDTSITTKVPAGATSGPVTVIAHGVKSNSVTFKVGGKLAAPGQLRVKR
jgi:Calx-beta domain/IPT/TIG domain/Fibronectin type III domain